MKKEYLKKWRRLDNTAKIFSLDNKTNTNIFRYSVVLKSKINKNILEIAIDKSLKCYPSFKVKIGTGFFWNYFEYNFKKPIVEEESGIPCEYIDVKENNDYIFKITYFKNKINLDVFHVLTDGNGAIQFLKSILYNYLNIKYNIESSEDIVVSDISYHDQYLKCYDKKIKVSSNSKSAFQLKDKVIKNINNTYHFIINVNEIRKVCKGYNATITEYLTAVYIYALYLSMYKKDSKKEIIITVPINLRKYYQVNTLSNFFTCMDVNAKIVEKKLETFDEILLEVKKEFEEKLTFQKVKGYLTRDVKLGMNIPIRLVPLFIKKVFINLSGSMLSKTSTSTLSNVGVADIDKKYKKYIDNILVLVMPNKNQKLKCTICSYDDKLNITMNSNIDDIRFEKTFFSLLKRCLKKIKIESNRNINLIK